MLKRNPDATIFCDGPDDAPAGVCAHCGGVTPSTAEYCGLDCRLKASEAASAKRIADLEAKLEELLTKEQMREGAERAVEEAAWAAQEREIAYAQARMEAQMEWMRQMQEGAADRYHREPFCNCIPSRASLLTDREHTDATLEAAKRMRAAHLERQRARKWLLSAPAPVHPRSEGPFSHIMPLPAPRASEIAERALKNGDRSPLTDCVDWVNATVARFSALGGAAD